MLILLPPSEGKAAPRRGAPLDLAALSSPVLTDARAAVLDALVALCAARPEAESAAVLGLGPTQAEAVRRNAGLTTAPAARADRVYAGVLYDALDLASLTGPARRRASSWLATTSALFGLVRPADRIPAYRLSAGVDLPGVGPVARHWAASLGPAVEAAAGRGLVVDLRSSAYAAFWRPDREHAGRRVTVRVLHETAGRRAVVSHLNKATKGRLVRAVLEEGETAATPAGFATLLRDLGWTVEADPVRPTSLDVVVGTL